MITLPLIILDRIKTLYHVIKIFSRTIIVKEYQVELLILGLPISEKTIRVLEWSPGHHHVELHQHGWHPWLTIGRLGSQLPAHSRLRGE